MSTCLTPSVTTPIDDGTRREFVAGGAALLLGAAGCGDADTPAGSGTRTVRHAKGTTEIPVAPKRIVTLSDQNALVPVLELGARPVGSAGADGTSRFRRAGAYDTRDIEYVGPYLGADVEKVAALQPDLIITNPGDETPYRVLSRIAPTVVIEVLGRPLTQTLLQFADVVGRPGQGRELATAYEDRVSELRSRLSELERLPSVSILNSFEPGTFYVGDPNGGAETLRDLGLPRPPLQRDGGPGEYRPLSLERLSEQDADVVLVIELSESAGPVADLVGSPLYRRLAGVRAGQARVIDGEPSAASSWASMDAFIDQLSAVLLDPRLDVDVVEEAA